LDDAIDVLLPISKNEQPQLAEYASRAKALIRELAAECSQRRITADEAYRRAAALFETFDFDAAARILEAIPAPFRTDAIVKLGARIAAKQEEITAITKELCEAVRGKRLLNLPSRIERLLALKPDHTYGLRLANQVRPHLVAAAKQQLAQHHYEQAFRLLEQIAPDRRDPETQGLYRQAAELAWLTWDLRNAPVIDRTLVAAAERLRRLAPGDARVIKPCAEVQRRAHLIERGPSGKPLPWARPPHQTVLGVPIDCPSGFRRLRCVEGMDQSDLRQGPGRFAVACGLALAGIRQASIEINLLPAENRGLLSQVTRFIQPRNTRRAWGIDVGASGLKAVRIAWDHTAQRATIEAATLIEHTKLLNYAVNDVEKKRLVTETLQAFLERQQPKAEQVCVGLPARMALSHQVDSLPVDADNVAKVVEFAASNRFPVPLAELDWGFQLFDDNPVGGDGGAVPVGKRGRTALLIAARQVATDQFLDAFIELGVRVDMLQTDSIALHNFVRYECFPHSARERESQSRPVLAALDIGAEVTNVAVISPHLPWFQSCGVAGHSFTRALVKDLNLSLAQAEQRKRAPETAERFGDICETLSPVFEDLSKEVQRSLAAFAKTQPDHPVQQVLVFGGGAILHGLFRYLRCGR
jgi:type IV pilus assembly protein PilM